MEGRTLLESSPAGRRGLKWLREVNTVKLEKHRVQILQTFVQQDEDKKVLSQI